jgi:hypothetical protein
MDPTLLVIAQEHATSAPEVVALPPLDAACVLTSAPERSSDPWNDSGTNHISFFWPERDLESKPCLGGGPRGGCARLMTSPKGHKS